MEACQLGCRLWTQAQPLPQRKLGRYRHQRHSRVAAPLLRGAVQLWWGGPWRLERLIWKLLEGRARAQRHAVAAQLVCTGTHRGPSRVLQAEGPAGAVPLVLHEVPALRGPREALPWLERLLR